MEPDQTGSALLSPARGPRPDADDDQTWSAARCLRLLRRAPNLLGLLRKLSGDGKMAKEDGQPQGCQKRRRERSPPPASDGTLQDRKRPKHTYSRKDRGAPQWPAAAADAPCRPKTPKRNSAKATSKSPAPGRIDLSTLFLRSALRQSPAAQARSANQGSARVQIISWQNPSSIATGTNRLGRKADAARQVIYGAMASWLAEVLRSTKSSGQQNSLLAMTLRKLPQFLRGYEQQEREMLLEQGSGSDFDQPEASIRIYHELELLFAPVGKGWRPLRVLVRAHAVAMLDQAISDHTLDPEYSTYLARQCFSAGAAEEGFRLLDSVVRSRCLPRPGSARSILGGDAGLTALKHLAATHLSKKTLGPTLARLSGLLLDKQLPVDWLCTADFTKGVWQLALADLISSACTGRLSLEFGSTALRLMAGRLQSLPGDSDIRWAMEQTMISVVAPICATALTHGRCGDKDATASPEAIAATRKLAQVLVDGLGADVMRKWSSGHYVLALAVYLVSGSAAATLAGPKVWQELKRWSREILSACLGRQGKMPLARVGSAGQSDMYSLTVGLISSIAHLRGRVAPLAARRHISEMAGQMAGLGTGNLFGRLRSDCAFSVAGLTDDIRDVAFAESVQEGLDRGRISGSWRTDWRWEEGISEWVSTSPVGQTKQDRCMRKPLVSVENHRVGADGSG